ncbi:MAG TPA: DUF4242 domain-containing protein [Acidimicrobiales bacterium]|nr:DUF4242 domain-containing protein [Acidimicrobiales bacterium]
MPRYVVQRTFPDGLAIPTTPEGADACLDVVQNNAEEKVTWVTSYVTTDRARTYCVYDGPSPESVRRAATANGLPVDAIAEVRVLDPYFYTGPAS